MPIASMMAGWVPEVAFLTLLEKEKERAQLVQSTHFVKFTRKKNPPNILPVKTGSKGGKKSNETETKNGKSEEETRKRR